MPGCRPSVEQDLHSPKHREAEDHPQVREEELKEAVLILNEKILEEGQVTGPGQELL